MRRRFQQAGLSLGILVLCLGLAEAVARCSLTDAYYVWPPNFEEDLDPDPTIIHGITGTSRLTINAIGIRGGPFTEEQRYRLLAVGGSTTICTYLDDTETWPYLVQERLNARLGSGTIWVGNVGRPGHLSGHNQLQVKELLRQHPEIDGVLLLVGINDFLVTLNFIERGWIPPSSRYAHLKRAFSIFPGWDEAAPWYQRTALGRPRWRVPEWLENRPAQDRRARVFALWRGYRREASALRADLPDLSGSLVSYTRQLNAIIDAAEAEDARVLFMTQPTLWRPGLSQAELDLLWTGGPREKSGDEYYAVEALAAGMELYNDALRRVCRDRGTECIDVAAILPKELAVFWDDAHFTEEGARRLAEIVAGYLLAHEPLAGLRRGADEEPRRGADRIHGGADRASRTRLTAGRDEARCADCPRRPLRPGGEGRREPARAAG